MKPSVCIHGHFYQPPRENPWLEEIETQDSAHPFHDWNQRITAECYAPNSSSRILGSEDRITAIVNNYAGMSFDFGPTLLSWLELHERETYAAILDADRISRDRFGGFGSARLRPTTTPSFPWLPAAISAPRYFGASGILSTGLGAGRRACGSRKRRWTGNPSISWPNRGSASRSWPLTRPPASGSLNQRPGRMWERHRWTPGSRISAASNPAGPSPCSSMTALFPGKWLLETS